MNRDVWGGGGWKGRGVCEIYDPEDEWRPLGRCREGEAGERGAASEGGRVGHHDNTNIGYLTGAPPTCPTPTPPPPRQESQRHGRQGILHWLPPPSLSPPPSLLSPPPFPPRQGSQRRGRQGILRG